jgi:hypothetical protein
VLELERIKPGVASGAPTPETDKTKPKGSTET